MAEDNNPIKRIYETLGRVFEAGRLHYRGSRTGLAEAAGSAVIPWMIAFRINTNSEQASALLDNALTDVFRLIVLAEELVRANESLDEELYSLQLGRVKDAVFSIRGESWNRFRERFGDDFLTSLKWAARDLSINTGEQLIPDGELENLQLEIENLTEEILQSSLDERLQEILVDGLTSLRQSIIDYRISGAEGIRQALDRNLGLILRNREEFSAAQRIDNSGIFSRYWDTFSKAENVIFRALKYIPIAQPIIERMLEAGGGGD